MIELQDIRYIRLGTRDLAAVEEFATQILGLTVAGRAPGMLYMKSDQRDHTLCYFEGDPAHQIVGLEIKDPDALSAAAAELEQAGHPVRRGTREECEERRVWDFIATRDPTGNNLEIVARPFHSGVRYHGARDAGVEGFNHIGLFSTDPVRDEAFWTKVFNARVSDWVSNVALLRISTVHHSIALAPSKKPGIHHINHQVASIDDLMKSFYFLQEKGVNLRWGPGRHASSGAIFLYFDGPDGIVYEYSCGVGHITAEQEPTYRPRQLPYEPWSLCYWGSKQKGIVDLADTGTKAAKRL